MAILLQAVTRYGPKLEKLGTVGVEDIAESIARRTGLNISEIMMMIQEMSEGILEFNRDGRPVRFPGVGIFTPSIKLDGEMVIRFRADSALKRKMNTHNFFRGGIKNSENIGADNARLKELWDAEFPADPLEIPAG